MGAGGGWGWGWGWGWVCLIADGPVRLAGFPVAAGGSQWQPWVVDCSRRHQRRERGREAEGDISKCNDAH